MKYIKTFENHNNSTLIIVDVQKSFKKYYTDNYLEAVQTYAKKFENAYQIFDNHHKGKNPDIDYLYDKDHDTEDRSDLYDFGEKDIIEKRYRYDVDAEFYKKVLSKKVYDEVKSKEDNKQLKRGDFFHTKEGTIIVYIANRHVWFDCPKKLYDLFISLKGKEVTIIGGSSGECILDVSVAGKALGVNIIENKKFIYSASDCPIK